jgi:transposase
MRSSNERRSALDPDAPAEVAADKGYHSDATLLEIETGGLRSYISEPDRRRRRWKDDIDAQIAVYSNRRRIRGDRGRRLQSMRGERSERSFAHLYETGGMRRTYMRGHDNIRKRAIVHASSFNLSVLLQEAIGRGTPRGLQRLLRLPCVLMDRLRNAVGGVAEMWARDLGRAPVHRGSSPIPDR